jgi:hypothetical protein
VWNNSSKPADKPIPQVSSQQGDKWQWGVVLIQSLTLPSAITTEAVFLTIFNLKICLTQGMAYS